MSNFTCNNMTPDKKALDPHQRVNYTMGLVLGVDEFEQEQFYLMERDRLHHRLLHGYGTAAGLKISKDHNGGNPKIIVSPGMAVNPRGESMCVPVFQCALVNNWLVEHQEEVIKNLGSPPLVDKLTLYLVLCYTECETGFVPIPGAPCRSQDDTMAASRIADSFQLTFSFQPPEQLEENVIRRFGDLLRRIEITDEITDGSSTYITLQEMEDLVRELLIPVEAGSPPQSPIYWSPDVCSPPEGYYIYVNPCEAAEIIRAAFAVWLTEVRPELLKKAGLCGDVPMEACVLLAKVDIDLQESSGIWQVYGGESGIHIDESQRPLLLHTRLLQEWMAGFRGPKGEKGDKGDTGDQGLPGRDGIDGRDGTNGTDGRDGIDGRDGTNGTDGRDGVDGRDGTNGTDGRDGVDGAPGERGPIGPAGPTGPHGAPGPGLEEKLTRIVATSWLHRRYSSLVITIDDTRAFGVIVGFGKKDLTDEGRAQVRPGSLDMDTFELFVDVSDNAYMVLKRIIPEEVIPVDPVYPGGIPFGPGIITGAKRVPLLPSAAKAAAILISPKYLDMITPNSKILIVLKGDFVLDESKDNNRAIDAEFLRGQLPTGDRPLGSDVGIQGGRFESWILYGQEPKIDVNVATLEEIVKATGVISNVAKQIVNYRTNNGPFYYIDDLLKVTKMTPTILESMKKFIDVLP